MAKVIAIGNNKGGIGKTTTSVSLATGLAKEGKRVLAIDNDPQGNLSKCLGIDEPASLDITLETILNNIVNAIPFDSQSGIIKTKEGVDLMPTNIRYSGMELVLFSAMNREQVLKEYVTMMRSFYDYIIIDCQKRSTELVVSIEERTSEVSATGATAKAITEKTTEKGTEKKIENVSKTEIPSTAEKRTEIVTERITEKASEVSTERRNLQKHLRKDRKPYVKSMDIHILIIILLIQFTIRILYCLKQSGMNRYTKHTGFVMYVDLT